MNERELMISNLNAVCKSWGLDKQTELGLGTFYDVCVKAKSELRSQLSKHPEWSEEAQAVVTKVKCKRLPDRSKFIRCMDEFIDRYQAFSEYSLEKCLRREIFDILRGNLVSEYTDNTEGCFISKDVANFFKTRGFDDMYPNASEKSRGIWEEFTKYIKEGQKASRTLNKFCELIDASKVCGTYFDAHDKERTWYEQWFARCSDAMNPHEEILITTLSINPCDFLNMSHGTGWQSCHNMRGGGYRAGCLSYAEDNCTMILSTMSVSERDFNAGKLFELEKINRQLYMWNGGTLLCSRLYPNNDDNTKKEVFKGVVKEIVCKCLGVDNTEEFWGKEHFCGRTANYLNSVESAEGYKQYPDYMYDIYKTSIFLMNGMEHPKLSVGAIPISLIAGIPLNPNRYNNGEIFGMFSICAQCGKIVDELSETTIHIGDKKYCSDCAFICGICHEAHLRSDRHNEFDLNGSPVCDRCFEANQRTCEFCKKSDFKGVMVRGRQANGNYNGKYAHKTCVPASHSICNCGSYQRIEHTGLFNFNGNERRMCPACSSIVVDWMTQFDTSDGGDFDEF